MSIVLCISLDTLATRNLQSTLFKKLLTMNKMGNANIFNNNLSQYK